MVLTNMQFDNYFSITDSQFLIRLHTVETTSALILLPLGFIWSYLDGYLAY